MSKVLYFSISLITVRDYIHFVHRFYLMLYITDVNI